MKILDVRETKIYTIFHIAYSPYFPIEVEAESEEEAKKKLENYIHKRFEGTAKMYEGKFHFLEEGKSFELI